MDDARRQTQHYPKSSPWHSMPGELKICLAHRRHYFWPRGHYFNKICRGLLGDASYVYHSSKLCGFDEQDFLRFSYEKDISPGMWPFLVRGHNLNKLSRWPLGDNTYQISKVKALWFQRRRFFKVFLYNSM